MPLKYARTYKGGLPAISQPIKVDPPTIALVNEINGWRRAAGVVVRPGDNVQALLNQCIDGDTVLLLPGTYPLLAALTVAKRLRIVGHGATLQGATNLLDVTANDAEVCGLSLHRTSRTAAQGAARLAGNGCRVWGCTVRSASPAGLRVEGDYCGVQDCKFLADGAAVAGDADVYWADGATFGICCGTLWSRTAGTFALDYRALDQMTEAANGVVAIINVR